MAKATLKVTLKSEKNEQGLCNVRLRFTFNRLSRYVSLPIYLPEASFNKKGTREKLNWIRQSHPNHTVFNDTIRKAVDRALDVIRSVEGDTDVSADSIRAAYQHDIKPDAEKSGFPLFIEYGMIHIRRMGDGSTANTYKSALNTFVEFLNSSIKKQDIPFSGITKTILKDYKAWGAARYKKNTNWIYYGRLKAVYYAAQEEYEDVERLGDPFRRITVSKEKTNKERLVEGEIDALAALELPWGKKLRKARDLCLTMYYAQGMRVGDALMLRRRNYVIEEVLNSNGERVVHHRLNYIMEKTGRARSVKLPEVLIQVLQPYLESCEGPDDALFPFMRGKLDRGYDAQTLKLKKQSVESYLSKVPLPKLAQLAGINKHLTSHVFRHSFADMLRRQKFDTSRISMALGHNSIKTTETYIREFDQQAVDEVQDVFNQENNRKTKLKILDDEDLSEIV